MIRTKSNRQSRTLARITASQKAARKVTKAARDFFKSQAERLANKFKANGGVLLASELMHAEDENERLQGELVSPLLATWVAGAQLALTDVSPLRRAISAAYLHREKISTATLASIEYEIDALEIELEIPRELLLNIRAALEENLSAPYWPDIQGVVVQDLQAIIDSSVADGLSIAKTAQAIQNSMGNMSRTRAVRIARTEVSGALNGGQVAGIQQIEAESGLAMTKEWLSVHGSTTRETHSEADGQEVPVAGEFTIGGHACRFPGDWRLPAEERINCQCGVLSGFLGV